MKSRRLSALVALPSAIVLAACSSSTSGKGSTGGSATGTHSAAGGKSTGSAPGGKPTDAAGLGGLMQSAIAGIRSARIGLDIDAAGQKVTGSGVEKLVGGKLVALDITEQLPGGGGSLQLIIVDGKTYAKLPPALNTGGGGKPYVLVSPKSSNPTVRALAGSLDSALSSASIGSVNAFITAAKTVTPLGEQTINGVKTTHYAVVVDIAKLPADLPGKDSLVASGLTTLPLDLYVDDQGRPIQVSEDFKVQGQQVKSLVNVSDYNKPVTVTAPPASQVSTN